jgi:hypothetical protein
MTQHPGMVKGDAQLKLGSAGYVVAAILFVIGGLLMPHAASATSDLREMLTPLGEQSVLTQVSSLLLMIAFWAAMVGAMGVYRSITSGGAAWARLGFSFVLVGTTLWTVSLSLDVATARLVANWLAAPAAGKDAAWNVIATLNAFGQGVLPSTWIVYWLAYVFLSVAMIHSAAYPRWLGWCGLWLASPVVALGIIQMFTARSTTLTLVFAVLMLLFGIWDLVTGIWVARRAW